MKSIAGYFFLILYTLALCKPVLPLIHDELAHTFWKAEHIATVHHHHGDHHTHEEVAKVAHEDEGDKQSTSTKTSEPVSVHIVLHTFYNTPLLATDKRMFATSVSNISIIYPDKNYPPPKFC